MKYILNEPWCLRGWKNKPYCLCDFTSPAKPIDITEGDMGSLRNSVKRYREARQSGLRI